MGTSGRGDPPIEEWEEVYTVTEITDAIRQSLESEFSAVQVLGEIANFKAHTSGHLYFSLRDDSNLIRTVVFRRHAGKITFGPDNGMLIIASGRISHYGGSGQTQLVADRLIPAGRGVMELGFRALLQKLMGEGLTSPERKRPIPRYPSRLVVVTSESGAVINDIIDTLNRRWPVAEIVHIPVAVQGPDAVPSIVKAFELSNRLEDVDAVILARGGGSIEDLWAFNSEEVARAVARSVHPVITGIGHEIDTTVADYVSDIRAATPTAAAELAAPPIHEVRNGVVESIRRLAGAFRGSHERRLHLLEYLMRSSSFAALVHRCEQAEFKLDDAFGKLGTWWRTDKLARAGALDRSLNAIRTVVIQSWGARGLRLSRLLAGVAAGDPRVRIASSRGGIENLLGELVLRTGQSLELARRAVQHNVRAIDGLHPRTVLKRGYTYCTTAGGDAIIGRIGRLAVRDDVTVHFYDGTARCSVIGKRKGKSWQKK